MSGAKIYHHTYRPGIYGVRGGTIIRPTATVATAPGAPRNGLPVGTPYEYHGSGRDTLTGFMDATMSLECLDEQCGKCTDPDCACACDHEPAGGAS